MPRARTTYAVAVAAVATAFATGGIAAAAAAAAEEGSIAAEAPARGWQIEGCCGGALWVLAGGARCVLCLYVEYLR